MSLGKATITLAVVALVAIALAGPAQSGTMSISDQYLHFKLGSDQAYVPSTTFGDYLNLGVDTIPISVYWDDGHAPSGTISQLLFTFTYDTGQLVYVGSDLAGCVNWPGDTHFTYGDIVNGRLPISILFEAGSLQIDPNNPPTAANPLVFLKVLVSPKCGSSSSPSSIDFNVSQCSGPLNSYNFLIIDDVFRWPACGNYVSGICSLLPYTADFSMESKNPVFLGQTESLTVYLNTACFKVQGIHHEFIIDQPGKIQNLQLIPLALPYGGGLTPPNQNGLFKVDLVRVGSLTAPPQVALYRLKFKIVPAANGDNTTVHFTFQTGTSFVWVAGCPNFQATQLTFPDGVLTIPAYEAWLKLVPNTPTHMLRKSDLGQTVGFDVQLRNNFPSGINPDQTSNWPVGNIRVNLDEECSFSLSQLPTNGTPLFFNNTANPTCPIFLKLDLQHQQAGGSQIAPPELWTMRNWMAPSSESRNIVTANLIFHDWAPSSYENRYIQLLTPTIGSDLTQVKDTTGMVATVYNGGNGKLHYDTTDVQVVLGQYMATYGYNGSGYTVSNGIYIRNNFNVTEFSVQVNVGSCHTITAVTDLLSGVEVSGAGTSRTFYYSSANPELPPVGSDCNGLRKIATITYSVTCHCYKFPSEIKWSTVSFTANDQVTYIRGKELGQTTVANQFTLLTGNSIASKCALNIDPDPEPPVRKGNDIAGVPLTFAVHPNHPNPFNPVTTISFDLPKSAAWHVTIFNISGQVVKQFEGSSGPGTIELNWDAGSSPSGVYLYRVEAAEFTATNKMLLLK